MKNRIIEQVLKSEGILTTWENGDQSILPYLIDENGQAYADLDPNKEIWDYDNEGRVLPSSLEYNFPK